MAFGRWGEQLAADHLQRAGWTIVARNFRSGHQEIDLIARRRRVLAFVEVKTRRSERYDHPFFAISERKRRAVEDAAKAWIARFGEPDMEYRFDAIAIIGTAERGYRLEHAEDAWGL
jgi:putative endonuclease